MLGRRTRSRVWRMAGGECHIGAEWDGQKWLLPRQPRSAQILTADSVQQQPIVAPGDQRSTTESTEVHGKENPNQLPLSVSFRVFRGYPFVMTFLAGVILEFPSIPIGE